MMWVTALAGVVEDDGVNLPDDPASGVVWVIIVAVFVGLYIVIRRTRTRAERDFEERRRRRDPDGGDDDHG